MSDRATAWHALAAEDCAARLGVDVGRGLDPAEAARRLEEHGPNQLPEREGRTRLQVLADQFRSPLVALLVGAAAPLVAMDEFADAGAIAAILVLNAALGYAQERRAADALAALRRRTAPTARVRRGGATQVVAAADLVPGDVVVIEAGDRVPADLRLARAQGLRCDEAALTGESAPVDKDPSAAAAPDAPVSERAGMAFLGTSVALGSADGVVVATGAATEFGRIAELVGAEKEPETPLQARLRAFGKSLTIACAAVVALVFLLGVLRGQPAVDMLLAAVSLAVAAVPEGLTAVVTVALALGVAKMARRRALIRRLPAVETLGSTSVICADKTGTLTVGEMTVRAVASIDAEAAVEGEGYAPRGGILVGGAPAALSPGDPLREILFAAAACSTARLVEKDGVVSVAGDPTEGALLAAAAKAGIDADAIERDEPTVSSLPFDADRKRMSIVRRRGGDLRAYVKGAPETVLPRCTRAVGSEGSVSMTDALRARAEALNEALAARGLRVLAVARRDFPGAARPGADAEEELTFLGVVGMHDPLRPSARGAVAACRDAGIRPVMITGDQPATALAVARELGVAAEVSEVMTGRELQAADDAALRERVESVKVYARVSPEHKLRIVRAWQARGAVVAMTGDGVNDAPALSGADIGVAMGRSGTDVAKDAAAMVVADDDFASIVAAVEEGRRIFENVRKTLLYLLSGNFAEILVMTVAVVAGWPLPLVPIQLLWINLVTDGLPALALATDPAERGLLRRPPRPARAEIADRGFIARLALTGSLDAACTLAGFLYGLRVEGSVERARTYAFAILVTAEALRAFAARSATLTLFEVGVLSNARLFAVVAATLLFQVLCHRWEPLGDFLQAGPLGWREAASVLAVGAVPVTVLELTKLLGRLRSSRGEPGRA